jgi:CheY-like chemotaxis protein
MGNRPIEIFLLCDVEDTPIARALSDQLHANGIVASYGHDLNGSILDRCQSVAVCVGENTSLAPNVCKALQIQFASEALRVIILYLPNAYWEDSAWLPASPIEFKSEDDPLALRELIATVRPSIQVFLCHSTTDKPAVRSLHRALRSDGFRPWLDEEDLIAGKDWELTIQNAVRASQVVIVCLSRAAVTKAGFRHKEIKLALDVADEQPEESIFLITARLEDCEVPSRLKKWQWVDLWTPEGYQKLLRALKVRAKELGKVVACGLTPAEVARLATWRPKSSGNSILIVDDNPDLLRFVTWVLEPKGWTVVTAESAQRAVEVILTSRQKPNIALLGYRLSDANGLAFGMTLKQQAPAMDIIITSASELTRDDLVTCDENGFFFLGKPFLRATLFRILDRIRRRQVRRRFEDRADAIRVAD